LISTIDVPSKKSSLVYASWKLHDKRRLSLRNICRCHTFGSLSTNRSNSLRRSHTHNRSRSRRRRLLDRPRRSHTHCDVSIAPALLPLDHNIRVAHAAHRQASSNPCLVVVIESNSPAAAIRSADAEVLAQITVIFRPQLVLGAVTGVVAVERVACVVGRIVFGEGVHDVKFYAGVACETIKGEVGISLRVVVCCIVDDTSICLAVLN
jgi:hypothetical protein